MLKDYGVSVILKHGDGYHSLDESEEVEEERDDRYFFSLITRTVVLMTVLVTWIC